MSQDFVYAVPTLLFSSNQKTIHFVRHAEGFHNVAGRNDPSAYLLEEFLDAKITPKGEEQCRNLHLHSKERLKNVDMVVVSPMNRTIQTGMHSFPQLMDKVPWVALEYVRERIGLHQCDRRHPISVHRENYPFVDFSAVESDEDQLHHKYDCREPTADMVKRGEEFLQWLVSRPEKDIVVITHSVFLTNLFSFVLPVEMNESRYFDNCEIRTFYLY